MPKRRREEEEETLETGNVDQGDFSDGDSEEDEDNNGTEKTDKYDVMCEDDIEGQEDPTQDFDGEVQITPFNMKEEMEEGHFDKEGTYIFGKRPKNEIKDHWLDNIDWVKVNSQPSTASINKNAELDMNEDSDDDLGPKIFNPISSYEEILNILLPGESVLKALKRLGGGKVQTASERWKKKKQEGGDGSKQNQANKETIIKLTELADNILSNTGNMDIYQETYEGIQFKVQQAKNGLSATERVDADLDMFGDAFDEKDNSRKPDDEGEPMTKKVRFNENQNLGRNADFSNTSEGSIMWEFKWENDEKAEIHGPHSTSAMQDWINQGYFESGVWVRRVGQGDFYSSRRVDFELYL